MLKDEWPFFFSKHLFYELLKVVLQKFGVFYCVHVIMASNQSTYAVRPNSPPKQQKLNFLKWAEKSQYCLLLQIFAKWLVFCNHFSIQIGMHWKK